jgi:hypothetical protein
MEWYWWVLIAAGVVAIAYVKIKVGGKMLASMKANKDAERAVLDED